MNPMFQYSLMRVGLFVVCAALALFLLPQGWDPLLKLVIAAAVSGVIGFFLGARMRDQVADQLTTGSAKRAAQKEKLRKALAGEDEPSGQHGR